MEKTPQKILPPLEEQLSSYKIIIPTKVERLIRYLCQTIPNVEWSGTLFYTYKGSFEENNLEIECVDIFPMDIGSSAYTEFEMSPDVISYMTLHPELLDCQMGLIHSHNHMATFFSGTDLSTLREEGNDRNHFVSLIVNNAGSYTAAITSKIKRKRTIHSIFTYKTFQDEEGKGESTVEAEEEVICYSKLTVIKEDNSNDPFIEMNERITTLKANKSNPKPVVTSTPQYVNNSYSYPRKTEVSKHPSLFDYDYMDSEPIRKVSKSGYDSADSYIPASLVKQLSLQLITGSIAISDCSKIDPVKWAQQMDSLFDKRFDKDMTIFNLWAETFAEFILVNFIPVEYYYNEDKYVSDLSKAIYQTLDKLPKNKYIESLKKALTIWIQ